MKTEMTAEEYVNLPKISEKKLSQEFTEAYKFLATKHPKETQGYSMKCFIDVAEAWTEED